MVGESTTPEIAINADAESNALQKLRSRNSAHQVRIQNELHKYSGHLLIEELTILIQKIIYQPKIPHEWRTRTTILTFKEGKKIP